VLFYFFQGAPARLSTNALFYLSQNPKVKENLLSELQQNFPDGAKSAASSFSWEKLNSLPYMSAVLKEVLRLSPPVTKLATRVALIDHRLGDIFIRRNTRVNLSLLSQNYNEKNFEQPEKFNPDRWIDGLDKIDALDQSIYTPFSFGNHYCPGQIHAFLIVKLILALLLTTYDFQTSPGQKFRWAEDEFYTLENGIFLELTQK
jgi:cytochrome P450